jgi:CheY-like chemotaxis protein
LLHADPHRLAQVLSNLLDNAAKYSPPGGNISLSARHDNTEVLVYIKDSGIGIPADMLDGVFEMFTRVERSDRTNAGLGIGLALVKSIVEMHGGRVEAHSEGADRGTEVLLRLPLLQSATATENEPPPTGEWAGHSLRRVLVVDDNEAAANLLAVVVEKFGHEVRVAYDGQQAIAVADRFQPDVVLMDLGMPNLDGYGAARHIRQQPWGEDMMLVAVTGWGQDGHKQRAKEAGFDYHLVKPADPAQLRQLLANAKPRLNHHAAMSSAEPAMGTHASTSGRG